MAVGPLIGGYLYDFCGLSHDFYFWSALGIVSIIIVMAKVDEPSRRHLVSVATPGPLKKKI